jgi:cobalt-zinc-cadmium efflux system membrane fusion protein
MNKQSVDGMQAARCRGRAPIGLAVMAAAALVSFTGCSSRSDNSPPVTSAAASNVTLTEAQRQNIHLFVVEPSKYRRTIEATGVVDFDNDQATSVLAPFSGPVSRLLVSPGDLVKKGAPLASVDSPDYSAAVSAYRKSLATARTNRRLADLDKDLLEHHGVSQREEDQAQTDAISAEADRDAALQALVSLQVEPQTIRDIQEGRPMAHVEAMIRAPIAGTVVEKLITPGELLQAGTTACFTVADLSRVWVMAQVFGSDLDSISLGDPAEVVTGVSDKNASGTVDNIAALVDPDTRAVQVRVVAENPGNLLKKQMYVRVLIQARQESSGLLVPVSALLRDNENLSFVYVAQPDGSFARQHVTLGYRAGDQVDITEGLHVGDKIVVEGGIFVQFMQNQ